MKKPLDGAFHFYILKASLAIIKNSHYICPTTPPSSDISVPAAIS